MVRLALVSVLVNYVHFQQFLNSSQSQLSNQQLLPNSDLTELSVEATKQYLAFSQCNHISAFHISNDK